MLCGGRPGGYLGAVQEHLHPLGLCLLKVQLSEGMLPLPVGSARCAPVWTLAYCDPDCCCCCCCWLWLTLLPLPLLLLLLAVLALLAPSSAWS